MKTHLIFITLFFPIFLFAQKIPKKQIKKAELHYDQSIEFIEKGNFKEALEEIENAIIDNPKKIEYHIVKVNILFDMEEFQRGMGYLNRTVDYFPESSVVYNLRGSLMDALRYFENAIEDFTKAIEHAKSKKEKAIYYSNRGGSKSQVRDYDGAYKDLMSAYKITPKSKDVLNNLAMVCDEVGRPDETLVYLNQIIDIDSTYIPAYVNIGFKYQLMEEHGKAVEYLSKAIELDPEEGLGYSNISYSLMKLGRLEEALENINKSIELNPINPYAYRNRALIYLEQGMVVRACDDVDAGLELGYTKSYGDELEKLKEELCAGTRN